MKMKQKRVDILPKFIEANRGIIRDYNVVD